MDLRLRGLQAPLRPPFALRFPSRPSARSSLPAVAHVAPPIITSRSLLCSRPVAPVRLSRLLPCPCWLWCPVHPPGVARAFAFPVRLPSPAAACPCALPVLLPLSAAGGALAFPLCLPLPAAARALAHPWCLPHSSAACHLPAAALHLFPCASALCTPPRTITVPFVSPGPCLDRASLQLRQRDVHRRAFGGRGADGPWPPLGESSLRRVQLGGAHVGLARLDVGGVLGTFPALDCGRCGPGPLAQ